MAIVEKTEILKREKIRSSKAATKRWKADVLAVLLQARQNALKETYDRRLKCCLIKSIKTAKAIR